MYFIQDTLKLINYDINVQKTALYTLEKTRIFSFFYEGSILTKV